MLKSVEFNQFVSRSPLSKVNPFLKTLTLLIVAFSLILLQSVATLLWLNLFILLIVFLAKLSAKQLFFLLITIVFAIYGIAISQGLFYANYPRTLFYQLLDIELFGQSISLNLWREGLQYGLKMSLRFTAPFMLAYLIYLTTSTQEYLESLAKSKIPFELAFMISIAIRFIPIVFEEYRTIRIVQQLKGYKFRFTRIFKSIRTEIKLLVPLFFHSLRHSKKLAESIVGRAYKSGVKRHKEQIKFKLNEKLYLIVLLLSFAILILLKSLYFLYANDLFIISELREIYAFCRFYL